MIKYNIPPYTGAEDRCVIEAIHSQKIGGDGQFTKKCNAWIETKTQAKKAMLTTSCTHAMEMSAFLANIGPGDEVIMPSFNFVSTANAFVMRGARIVFVDIRPDTMNIDEMLLEQAITKKTKAIVPVHYAGVACEMDTIKEIAKNNHICVIEDAAQGVMATYKGRFLGALGSLGCFSFHETKNYSMGEGGALLVNDDNYAERSEIIREKGTNRSRFLRGQVDKYTWVDIGSSYLPSDINAAYLWPQLEQADAILADRVNSWKLYYNELQELCTKELIELPIVPSCCIHNGHIFYIKVKDIEERTSLISYLRSHNIEATFHYVPLHSSVGGKKYGTFIGKDNFTTSSSERLIRLPLYYGLAKSDLTRVVQSIYDFFAKQ